MDFKEYERQAAQDAQEVKEVQNVNEVQGVSNVQEANKDHKELTPAEIKRAGDELTRATQVWASQYNPKASERDAYLYARASFFGDFLEGAIEGANEDGRKLPQYKDLSNEIRRASEQALKALKHWEEVKTRFYQSEQWHKLQEAFEDITPELSEILLDVPDFLFDVVDNLPGILQEKEKHERMTRKKVTFKELVRPAGDLPDVEDPRTMLLFVFFKRALQQKDIEAKQMSGELSKTHIASNTNFSNAIRGGLIGAGPKDITIRNGSKKREELTQYAQLYFSFDCEGCDVVDPLATSPAVSGTAEQETFIVSDELREILKIDGPHTGADDVNREAIYTKIINAENSGRDWRQLQFTATNIWKEKNHTTKDPSPQAKAAVTKSIEKQWRLFADLDLTNYAKMGYEFYNPETGRQITEYRDHFLKLARFKEQGGYYFYRLTAYPIELLIAKQLNQIISYPAALLEVHEVTPAGEITDNIIDITEDRTAIITNLYRIVYNMKYQWRKAEDAKRVAIRRGKATEETTTASFLPAVYQQHFRILFDTLFQDAGIKTTDRKQLNRYRDFVFQVLDYCKAYWHQGKPVIKDWHTVKGGRGGKIRGIDIEL